MSEYHYGIAPIKEVARLSGREFLQGIIDGVYPQAPISEIFSFWLVEVGEGSAVFEGEPNSTLLNPMGTVHGGWSMTLIDSVCGCAGYSLLPAGSGYTTVETKCNFTKPILPNVGRVRAEATVIAQGKQLITVEARVLGADGRVLAHGTSTLMVLQLSKIG